MESTHQTPTISLTASFSLFAFLHEYDSNNAAMDTKNNKMIDLQKNGTQTSQKIEIKLTQFESFSLNI